MVDDKDKEFLMKMAEKCMSESRTLSVEMMKTTEGYNEVVSYLASLILNKFMKGEVQKLFENDPKLDILMEELEMAATDMTTNFFRKDE